MAIDRIHSQIHQHLCFQFRWFLVPQWAATVNSMAEFEKNLRLNLKTPNADTWILPSCPGDNSALVIIIHSCNKVLLNTHVHHTINHLSTSVNQC